MLQRRTTGRALRVGGAGALVVGAGAALGGTLGAGPSPLPTLLAGLALVGVGLAALAAGQARIDDGRSADALLVLGFVGYHVAALLGSLALAAGVLLDVVDLATAALWVLAALGAVLVAWGWERRTGVDVDAALEDSRFSR